MAGLSPDLGRTALAKALEVGAEQLGWDSARCEAEAEAYRAEVRKLSTLTAMGMRSEERVSGGS